MLLVGSFVGGGGDGDVGVTTDVAATAGDGTVRTAAVGTPSGVRALLSETTTTLVEATGATTTTSAPEVDAAPSTTVSQQATEAGSDDDDTASTTSTTGSDRARALHTHDDEGDDESAGASEAADPTTTTTAAPRPAPSTTAAPATTTTTAPEPSPASRDASEGGYAYDDPRSTQVWYDLAQCESGGNWSIDTGNGYYGGLQFSLPTWESVGGSGYPHEHPAGTQIELGRRLQARQGWGAWPHCSEELGLR